MRLYHRVGVYRRLWCSLVRLVIRKLAQPQGAALPQGVGRSQGVGDVLASDGSASSSGIEKNVTFVEVFEEIMRNWWLLRLLYRG